MTYDYASDVEYRKVEDAWRKHRDEPDSPEKADAYADLIHLRKLRASQLEGRDRNSFLAMLEYDRIRWKNDKGTLAGVFHAVMRKSLDPVS